MLNIEVHEKIEYESLQGSYTSNQVEKWQQGLSPPDKTGKTSMYHGKYMATVTWTMQEKLNLENSDRICNYDEWSCHQTSF